MNTLNIVIPYEYVKKLIDVTWNDILFAIEYGFMIRKSAIEHAFHVIGCDPNPPQNVIDLAWAKDNNAIFLHLDKITNSKVRDDGVCKKKFLYLILNWVYENKSQYPDPLGMVEVIYADFGYPTEISEFVRYMPAKEPIFDSVDENIDRLFLMWKSYLEQEKIRYLKD